MKSQRQAIVQAHGSNMQQLRDMRAGSVLGASVGGKSPELPTNPGRTGRSVLEQDNRELRNRMLSARQFG